MTAWDPSDLDRIGGAAALRIASQRPDGTLRPFVIIWAVRVADAIYIRSAHGSTNPWYVRARDAGRGRIQAGGVDLDATFTVVDPGDRDIATAVTAAFEAKYGHFSRDNVEPVVDDDSVRATLRIDPR
jgi:hypothetical protein